MHTKTAVKRLRTSKEANLRNRMRKNELKTVEKKFRAAIDAGDTAGCVEIAKTLSSCLDKAAKVGTIHANKVANKKSQIDKMLNELAK